MDYSTLGKTGKRLSEIGLGTWKLGANEAGEIEALRAGIDSGINFIDTAEIYGTEPIVAKAIAGRENLFIATKVSPTHFHYDDVLRSCDASLQRLGVSNIDLYQLHWPNRDVPIDETMRAMEKLVADGKIRHIGVSNFSVKEMEAAQAALKSNEIVSNQVEYSMLVREPELGLADYCRKEQVSIIAYSPLARGHLLDSEYSKLKEMLGEIGKKHGKTATQVSVNWLISKGNVIPIPKAAKKEHVIELVGAAGWRLSKEEMASIDAFLSSTTGAR
ncbi:MAG: aldo/keto reductase [Candidatus Marsarchaeota archaeon]|nr:aldo/keto reductase [Candidatus Marsarchaeota archaeon]